MKPDAQGAVRSSPEQARAAIESFLAASKCPVVVDPGDPPFPVTPDNYALEWRSGYLTIEIWDERRHLSRRITGILSQARGRLELSIERFGKRAGTLSLIDTAAAPAETTRKAARMTYRERFRRALSRQFPEWRIVEVSTDPDLEHSLSPTYPRAFLRLGTRGMAAIGAGPDSDSDGVLTFGLIWLDYLRTRERRVAVEGLVVFLPSGRERTTCLRMLCLNPRAASCSIFVQTADGYEDPVDLADYGNIDTRLERATRPLPDSSADVADWFERIRSEQNVETVHRGDGAVSLRVRGLEFARLDGGALMWGLETRRPALASNLGEIVELAREIGRLRSPRVSDRRSPLYAKHPEGWLESQVRSSIQEIDATLEPSPVYGQAPTFTAGERGVIDLLAVDARGRLAVLELKASEDIHLPMQALDYWVRVKWHAEKREFGAAGYFPGVELRSEPPRLLLVAPALEFHPSNEAVMRYFGQDIEVQRIGVGESWRESLKVMFRHGKLG